MSGIIIDRDDLDNIIGALVSVADSGMCFLQEQPSLEDAQRIAGLCALIARLLTQIGDPNAGRYEHNASECTRLAASYELARVAGKELAPDIQVRS